MSGQTKLVVETGAIAAAAAELAKIVDNKPTIAVLGSILIEPADGGLLLTASNLDMQMSVPAPIVEGGLPAMTIGARRLADVLGGFDKGGHVTFEPAASGGGSGGRIKLRNGRSQATLPTGEATDFPKMPAKDDAVRFRMEAAPLRAAIDTVRFAMGNDETKPYLCGVSLSVHEGRLCVAASDGMRFALKQLDAPAEADPLAGTREVILPPKLAGLIAGIEDAGWLDIAIKPKWQVAIETPTGRQIIGKLIDLAYVDYRKALLALAPSLTLTAPRELLIEALGRARLLADSKERWGLVTLEPETLRITVRAQDGGEIIEELPCEWTGDPVDKGFNVASLLDHVKAVSGPDFIMECLPDTQKPNRIRGADADATFFLTGQK